MLSFICILDNECWAQLGLLPDALGVGGAGAGEVRVVQRRHPPLQERPCPGQQFLPCLRLPRHQGHLQQNPGQPGRAPGHISARPGQN